MSAKELRQELKELRKASIDHKPVSKLHKKDVVACLERMKPKPEPVMETAKPAKKAPEPLPTELKKSAPVKSQEKVPAKVANDVKISEPGKVSAKAGVKEVVVAPETMAERMARIRAMRGKKKEAE